MILRSLELVSYNNDDNFDSDVLKDDKQDSFDNISRIPTCRMYEYSCSNIRHFCLLVFQVLLPLVCNEQTFISADP
jgi:hypothetical protein